MNLCQTVSIPSCRGQSLRDSHRPLYFHKPSTNEILRDLWEYLQMLLSCMTLWASELVFTSFVLCLPHGELQVLCSQLKWSSFQRDPKTSIQSFLCSRQASYVWLVEQTFQAIWSSWTLVNEIKNQQSQSDLTAVSWLGSFVGMCFGIFHKNTKTQWRSEDTIQLS